MNNDLISREALKETINSSIAEATEAGMVVNADYLWELLNYAIDNAPTVEPERQVEKINKIPKDFVYDTETPEFYCYRNKYTGKEIHILKEPKTYTLERPQGECCGSCYLCDVGDCGADMKGGTE